MNAQANIDMNSEMSSGPRDNVTSRVMTAKIRPFFWSVRRELWENRSIYIAPAAIAALVLLAALVNVMRIPGENVPFHQLSEVSPQHLRIVGISLYSIVASIMAITAGLVGWFYSLDSLHGERRDRSVLFWKSLPLSDTTTVLSKVLVAMVIVPAIAIAVGIVLYLALLLIASITLMANGVNGMLLIKNLAFGESFVVHLYATAVAILWYAPLIAWAIFVSSWVRKATFLWALLPPAVIGLVELLAFDTTHFWRMISMRLSSGLQYAFATGAQGFGGDMEDNFDQLPASLLSLLDPGNFLSQPNLWIGLAVAIGLIAASIWMRRYREPI